MSIEYFRQTNCYVLNQFTKIWERSDNGETVKTTFISSFI